MRPRRLMYRNKINQLESKSTISNQNFQGRNDTQLEWYEHHKFVLKNVIS
jgi:hypothetical protein